MQLTTRHRIHSLVLLIGLAGLGPASLLRAEEAAAEKAAAPATAALLSELLQVDLGKPYAMAAIKFGPEFWAALEADAGGQAQDNLFRKLFSGGLLFGVGPLDNVLGSARGEPVAVRWTPPPTMKAVLRLTIEQPNVQVTVDGQLVPLRAEAPGADPNGLLNQLQFVYFPLGIGGGQATLADLARSMTLVITGLAPGAMQKFTWELAPSQPQRQQPRQQGPIVVQEAPDHRDQMRNQFEAAMAARGGAGGPAATMGMAPAGLGGGMGGAGVRPELAPLGPGPEPPATPEANAPGGGQAELFYPLSRTASNVGAPAPDANAPLVNRQPLTEAYVTIDQVSRADGNVTLDYRTSPLGQQEVEVADAKGRTAQRITSGPAPANGRALASWKPLAAKGAEEAAEQMILVRNTLATPLGMQVSEASAPLPAEGGQTEPAGAIAPGPPAIADVSVEEISVLGDLLQVRAHVTPVVGADGVAMPPVSITVTDEAGKPVKTLDPTPPALGKDYVFAWDVTDENDQRVPDGRYVLRVGTRTDSRQGSARSELRYWVDVPIAKMQRRLAVLGPTAVETLQVGLASQTPGSVLLAYFAPQAGRLKAFVVDGLGCVVRHLVDQDVPKGPDKLPWDGKDDAGELLPDAPYTVNFELDGGDQGAWWGVVTLDELPQPAGDGGQ